MDDDYPWWWYRCTHRMHHHEIHGGIEYGCWRVLKEAEGVVVLRLICRQQVHITVDLNEGGSVCKTLSDTQYMNMTDQDLMALVQSQRKQLRVLFSQLQE